MRLYHTLTNQLKKEPNFVSDDGELKKWVVLKQAENLDEELIELLLEEPDLKEKFFKEIKGILVFNQNFFIQFLEQKNYLNDSYTQFKNKVGLQIDGRYLKQRNEVSLVWPFKDCILEGGQSREEDKREEIFFNEILAQDEITQLLEPKVLTNAKVFDKDGEHHFKGFNRDAELNKKRGLPENTITDNLVIKGNNLLALHSIKKEFAGKVKLIYIDPPYNTGSDSFGYNDRFNHSTWLTFMKNRLEVARELLKEDGVIFVHLDDGEQAYTKILLDETFGRDNFVNSIAVRSSTPSGIKTAHKDKTIIKQKDFILVYRKSPFVKFNPQYSIRGNWDNHYSRILIEDEQGNFYLENLKKILIEQGIINENELSNELEINSKSFKKFYLENAKNIVQSASHRNKEIEKISRTKFKNQVYVHYENDQIKGFYYNGRQLQSLSNGIKKVYSNQRYVSDLALLLCDFWSDIDFQNTQNEGGVSFPTAKKPELLLSRIIELVTNENDIVLDYHLGSGTTNAVSLKSNRQFIGIEQLNYGKDDSIERLKNVIDGEQSGMSKAYSWQGGGSFVYLELKKYNQLFIEKIETAKSTEELLDIWEEMKSKSFLNYNIDIQKQEAHIEEFKELKLPEQKQHLCEILDKNQLYVNISSLDDKDFECSEEEKKATRDFYSIKKS